MAVDKAFTDDGLAAGGVVHSPRAWVEIISYIDGVLRESGIVPSSVTLHRGSHNKADESKVQIDGTAFDFPIRLIGGAEIAVYLGVAPDDNPNQPINDRKNLRFVGYVTSFKEDVEEFVASLDAQDLSYFCRRPKFPVRKTEVRDADGNLLRVVDPTPHYSDQLRAAIERFLSILPEFADPKLEPPLRLRDTAALNNANLSSLVSGRGASAPIPLKPDCTVWEAIEHLCGLLGLHVKVELRDIVVRTSEEVFAGRSSKATFIFGDENGNCFGPSFEKKPVQQRAGVKLIVFDPEQRKTIEAVYPSDSEVRSVLKKSKRPSATRGPSTQRSRKPKPSELAPPPRDVFELDPGHFTQDALNEKAKAIYLERSRQEADGEVASPIWTEEILSLQNADLVTIRVNPRLTKEIERIGDDDAASKMLQDTVGYEKEVADALVAAARKRSRDDWYAKEITFTWPSAKLATVNFINLVEV